MTIQEMNTALLSYPGFPKLPLPAEIYWKESAGICKVTRNGWGQIVSILVDNNPNDLRSVVNTYDALCQLVKCVYGNNPRNRGSKEFFYDNKGRLVECVARLNPTSEDSWVVTYDETTGYPVSKVHSQDSTNWNSKFNDAKMELDTVGNITYYQPATNSCSEYGFRATYNEKNQLVTKIRLERDGTDSKDGIQYFTYNDAGNITSHYWNNDPLHDWSEDRYYDKQGRLTGIVRSNNLKNPNSVKYIYDDAGYATIVKWE